MKELRDTIRGNLLRYTSLAFHLLPDRDMPRILDIGCGTGVPTLFLAGLSTGRITALDRDGPALESLRRKAGERGLADRITTCLASLDEIPFPDGSFDLLWCEGALHVLGFRESLRRWRRLLVPGGYLVAHDEAGDVSGKIRAAAGEGFTLQACFVVPEEVWWRDYCSPAEAELAAGGEGDGGADPDRAALAEEIRQFRENPESFRSAYFVLQVDVPV